MKLKTKKEIIELLQWFGLKSPYFAGFYIATNIWMRFLKSGQGDVHTISFLTFVYIALAAMLYRFMEK